MNIRISNSTAQLIYAAVTLLSLAIEREMIRERTKLGLARARLEGRVGGNRASLTPKQQAHALAMIDEGKSQSEVADVFRVHRSTICRLVSERRVLEHR